MHIEINSGTEMSESWWESTVKFINEKFNEIGAIVPADCHVSIIRDCQTSQVERADSAALKMLNRADALLCRWQSAINPDAPIINKIYEDTDTFHSDLSALPVGAHNGAMFQLLCNIENYLTGKLKLDSVPQYLLDRIREQKAQLKQ